MHSSVREMVRPRRQRGGKTWKSSRLVPMVALFGVTLWTAGCGPKLPKTVPVSGTVTYNGKPLEKATVSFAPQDPAIRPADGKTDASGNFKISTFNPADGVMPGQYKITVWMGEDESSGAEKQTKAVKSKSPIPEKYAKPQTSGFEETILGKTTDLKLELKD